jgi:hypothetical protein
MSELEVACPPIPPLSTTSHSCRQPGRSRANYDDIEMHAIGVDRPAGRLGDLQVGGVLEDAAVREQHQGELRPLRGRSDELPTFGRVGQAESVGHGAMLERIAQFVGASCP